MFSFFILSASPRRSPKSIKIQSKEAVAFSSEKTAINSPPRPVSLAMTNTKTTAPITVPAYSTGVGGPRLGTETHVGAEQASTAAIKRKMKSPTKGSAVSIFDIQTATG